MSETLFSWFSANDEGKVVAKTDVKENGEIHRYEYTEEDNVKKGHGHEVYENFEDMENGKPIYERDKDADESINRPWYGNGFNVSLNELYDLREKILNDKYYTSIKLLLKK